MIDISVITPTIRGRENMRDRAAMSVFEASRGLMVEHIPILDADYKGPAWCRNEAAQGASGEWLAFLDDDDEMYPTHLIGLLSHAEITGADLVYPWFDMMDGNRPIRGDVLLLKGATPFGQKFNPVELRKSNYIPVTVLLRKEAFFAVGGFPQPGTAEWPNEACEDWGLWLKLLDAGFTFSHYARRTWRWNVHGKNTSGIPARARRFA